MTAVDNALPALTRALATYGMTGVFRTSTLTPGAGGSVVESGVATVSARVAPLEPFKPDFVRDGVAILYDAKTAVLAAGLGFTPTVDQQLTVSGRAWLIIDVRPITASDVVYAYDLLLRG